MNGTPGTHHVWPMDGPPVAPSTVWIIPKDQPAPLLPVASQIPLASQFAGSLPMNPPERVLYDPGHPVQAVDTIIAPNCIAFVAPGLETRLYMNEHGDIYAKQIIGPNAGKSYNLTEGKWL